MLDKLCSSNIQAIAPVREVRKFMFNVEAGLDLVAATKANFRRIGNVSYHFLYIGKKKT